MRALIAVVLAGAALTLGACGEKTQVTVYEPGKYQGRVDAAPWANEQFKNNEQAWVNAIKARTLQQNEYARIQP